MNLFIHNHYLFITKKIAPMALVLAFLASCQSDSRFPDYDKGVISLPSGEILETFIADTGEQQIKGLSGLKPEQFKDNEAMLFTAEFDKTRQFWMPDTHFNLDIFFLTKDLYVLDVERNFPHFPHSGPKDLIPMTRAIRCRHVLEVNASSPLAKKIKPGMVLNWKGSFDLLQKQPNTRP